MALFVNRTVYRGAIFRNGLRGMVVTGSQFRGLRGLLPRMEGGRLLTPPPLPCQLPSSPSLLAPLLSSPSVSFQLPQPASSFDINCTRSESPDRTWEEYDTSTYEELHQLRRRRGLAEDASKAVLKTRLSAMDALYCKRARDAQDVSADSAGDRDRVEAKKRAHWRRPRLKEMRGATVCSPLEWVETAMSARAADLRRISLGLELSLVGEKGHAAVVRAAKGGQVSARSRVAAEVNSSQCNDFHRKSTTWSKRSRRRKSRQP